MLYPIAVFVRDSADLLIGFIDGNGTVKISPQFAGSGHFCEGLAGVVGANGLSGFLSRTGEMIIPLRFRGVGHFHDGLCSIGADHGVGYIDHSGGWVLEPKFLIAMAFSEGRAFVSSDGESFHLIDMSGSRIGRAEFARARPYRGGLAPVMSDRGWGFIDRDGLLTIPFSFEDTKSQHFTSALAAVKISGRWGFIDHSGCFAIKPYFDDVQPFAEGLAAVKIEGKWGMIDLGGRVRVAPKWDELGELVDGLAAASADGKAGYVDPTGTWAIDPVYDQTKRFFGELALVSEGNVRAYIRTDGQIVWRSEAHAIVPRPPSRFSVLRAARVSRLDHTLITP
jgi:hypothetical protein